MIVTGLDAVAAATERISTCGAAAASGEDPYPVSAAVPLSADWRGAGSSLLLLSPGTTPPPCTLLTHGKSVLLPWQRLEVKIRFCWLY